VLIKAKANVRIDKSLMGVSNLVILACKSSVGFRDNSGSPVVFRSKSQIQVEHHNQRNLNDVVRLLLDAGLSAESVDVSFAYISSPLFYDTVS
jgi:hypothetical protein